MKKIKPLGRIQKTHRGFKYINFLDYYGFPCSIQESSGALIEDTNLPPGQSALWIGCDEPNPRILASKASKYGISSNETMGWIEYPLPDDVLLNTKMHLDRKQIESLVFHFQNWLKKGKF